MEAKEKYVVTPQEAIDKLVSNLYDTCKGDDEFLLSIIRNGFRGFEEMTEIELEIEFNEVFGELGYSIKKGVQANDV